MHPESPRAGVIRALIVDDSAFARKVVREMLESSPHINVVGAARDGEEALEMAASLTPDIVVCDLWMPQLDGPGFVRRQMAVRPLPILILSAAAENAVEAIAALEAGALDVVRKPSALASDDLRAIREELVRKVREVMDAHFHQPLRNSPLTVERVSAPKPTKADVVVIGISTGGPQALRRMMPLFPADFRVPIAIVLHMPVGYTALYAEKLNEICALNVKEAAQGDLMLPGTAYVAAAGRHLVLRRRSSGEVEAHLPVQPLDKPHRPSVDVLFRSAAEVFNSRVIGVVMTGMGDDGMEGSAWIKAQGGIIITESEKSCVIYGMPRSVDEAGLSDFSLPLEELAHTIAARL